MRACLLLAIVVLSTSSVSARVFSKCQLAQELDRQGFVRESIPDWLCLVQWESSFNSTAIGGPNSNGSFDWGLFQINEGYWCLVGQAGNDCNEDCLNFVDDDITDDIECVRLIYARHGFYAWRGWESRCQSGLPSISDCF